MQVSACFWVCGCLCVYAYLSVILSGEVPLCVRLYLCASLRVSKPVCFSDPVGRSPRNLSELSKRFSRWAGCRREKLRGRKVLWIKPEAGKGRGYCVGEGIHREAAREMGQAQDAGCSGRHGPLPGPKRRPAHTRNSHTVHIQYVHFLCFLFKHQLNQQGRFLAPGSLGSGRQRQRSYQMEEQKARREK